MPKGTPRETREINVAIAIIACSEAACCRCLVPLKGECLKPLFVGRIRLICEPFAKQSEKG